MTQEQKVKAYDEAIEKLRGFYENYDIVSNLIDVKEELANLFPELKEKRGDRIKSLIYCLIRDQSDIGKLLEQNGVSVEEALDWIEKQGQQEPTECSERYIADVFEKVGLAKIVRDQGDDLLTNAVQSAMIELSKGNNTHEVEPKFHEGDLVISTKNHHLTYKVLEVGHINENGEPEYRVEIFVDGQSSHPSNIKYIRIQMMDEWGRLIEQKPSMEGTFVNVDEVREDFMQEVYRVLDADPTNDRANQIIDAFDNLPTVAIQPTEWSEEDSYMLGQAIKCVNNSGRLDVSTEEIEDWLKSLRPNYWKPSEDQMTALAEALSLAKNCGEDWSFDLRTLHEQLKKL